METHQLIGIAIFWIAGCVAVYFGLRDSRYSAIDNIRALGGNLPVLGAMVGFLLFSLAWATTGPDVPDYGDPDYFSRSGR